MTPIEAITALESVAAREVGRGSATLAAHTTGSLYRAARSLSTTSALDVAILTGFFIPAARPPAAETDGPLGAVQLAAAIQLLGGSVRLVTDEACAPVAAAAIRAAGLDTPLDIAPVVGYDEWERQVLPGYAGVSHLIACERVGPGVDGRPRNMRALDISGHTAPLHRLYGAGRWFRIGIGDGGNELGMGVLPASLVASVIERGDQIHCVVDCDALLIGGTSNWAAAALVAALAVLRPDCGEWVELLRPTWSHRVLTAMVTEGGAVDGVSRQAAATVDGLDWPEYAMPLAELERIARCVS